MTLASPDLVVQLYAERGVVSVAPRGRPDEPWLTGAGDVVLSTAEGLVPLGPPGVEVDVDEVQVERAGDGLRAVVRHGVGDGWDLRLVLVNESDTERVLPQVRLGLRPGPGYAAAALAAGAVAAYAVQPADGNGPVLLGRLRSGAQTGADEEGFVLGPLVLGPRHRWSSAWRFTLVPDARRASAPELPRTTWLDLDQTVLLPAGPDVAVVAPGLAVEEDLDARSVELGAGAEGEHTVELRSARGTTAFLLSWAPDLDDLVDGIADEVLAGSRTPAGTPRLGDAATGVLVQDALARHASGAPDDLADALELLAGDLVDGLGEAGEPDPVVLAFCVREADRTADPAVLDAALTSWLATARPVPGTGLAGVALALAVVGAGRPATAVAAHLVALHEAGPAGHAALELDLLLRPREAAAGADVLAALSALGARLGAGLPGRALPPVPLPEVAYASTLLGLVDEATGQRLRGTWGVSAAELGRRSAAEARARVAGSPADVARESLAWLVLGRTPR